MFSLEEQDREDALKQAKSRAKEDAIEAGADAATVEIIDLEEIPLSYLPGNAVRFKVQAAGDLDV